MRTRDAIRAMLDKSGRTPYSVSLSIGRAQSYVDAVLRRGGDVGAGVLSEIAGACGYRLVLIPKYGGEVIELDGRRDSD